VSCSLQEENGLRSLANLHHLTSLQALHVSNNRITEIADLDRLSSKCWFSLYCSKLPMTRSAQLVWEPAHDLVDNSLQAASGCSMW
jgi:hypothetical protein